MPRASIRSSHRIPHVYDISATASGFQTQQTKGIQVSADTSPKVDLKLQVGSSTQTVEVTSEIPQLKTDRADVAKVFDQRTVSDLPIAGRNFASLELLIPGAQVMAWSQNSAEDFQRSLTREYQRPAFLGSLLTNSTALPIKIESSARSSSTRPLMRSPRPRLLRPTTTPNLVRQSLPWLLRKPSPVPTASMAMRLTIVAATPSRPGIHSRRIRPIFSLTACYPRLSTASSAAQSGFLP